jgi:hypothetical protein
MQRAEAMLLLLLLLFLLSSRLHGAGGSSKLNVSTTTTGREWKRVGGDGGLMSVPRRSSRRSNSRGEEGKAEDEAKHEAIATMAVGAEEERMNQRQRRLTSEGHDEQIGSSGHGVQRVSENRGDDRTAPAENQSSGDGE